MESSNGKTDAVTCMIFISGKDDIGHLNCWWPYVYTSIFFSHLCASGSQIVLG